jgi:hypothetical protein
MPKWARFLTRPLVILALLILFFYSFGYQIMMMYETRHIASQFPVIDKTPVALTDLSVSPAASKSFSLPGYTFELPWAGIDASKSKVFKSRLLIVLQSGNAIIASSVPPQDFIGGLESTFKTTREKLRQNFGDQAVKSDYDLKRLILYTTRKQIHPFVPWRRSTSIGMLLMFKGVMVPTRDSELYTIQTGELRGFQLGDPEHRPAKMAIELYDDDGEIEFIFGQRPDGPTPGISQADLNCVIKSVHKTTAIDAALAN